MELTYFEAKKKALEISTEWKVAFEYPDAFAFCKVVDTNSRKLISDEIVVMKETGQVKSFQEYSQGSTVLCRPKRITY